MAKGKGTADHGRRVTRELVEALAELLDVYSGELDKYTDEELVALVAGDDDVTAAFRRAFAALMSQQGPVSQRTAVLLQRLFAAYDTAIDTGQLKINVQEGPSDN